MKNHRHPLHRPARFDCQRGFSLIEVMVTLMILAIGLLGLAGLQARAHNAEFEAYSRAQALILANDLADRMAANRFETTTKGSASAYNSGLVYGVTQASADCTAIVGTTSDAVALRDLCEWNEAIKGASQLSAGQKMGQLAGARGCVTFTAAAGNDPQLLRVTLAWQGRDSSGALADASSLTCGKGAILPETTRRAITVIVPFADLDGS